jgi:hypothetical protein
MAEETDDTSVAEDREFIREHRGQIPNEEFSKAIEDFRRDLPRIPLDPVEEKRAELQQNLLLRVATAAQIKHELNGYARGENPHRPAISYRQAERECLNALSTLIEWEESQC